LGDVGSAGQAEQADRRVVAFGQLGRHHALALSHEEVLNEVPRKIITERTVKGATWRIGCWLA
jgi:hypothetical protein